MTQSNAWSWRKAVVSESGLPPTTRHVLLTLSIWMNEAGEGCYPSIATLVESTGLSNRSVITHLQVAAEKGWIKVSQHGFRGKKWRANEYKAVWPGREIENCAITEQNEGENEENLSDEIAQNQAKQGGEGGSLPCNKVVNLTHEGGEPNDIKVVKEVHTNSPKNNPITVQNKSAADEPTNELSKHQKREHLKNIFDEFGLKKKTDDIILSQFREVWNFKCQRNDEAPRPTFIIFGLLGDVERAEAIKAIGLYAVKLAREKIDIKYRLSLKRWLSERGWQGMDISPEDEEAAKVAAENTFISQSKQPLLYNICLDLRYKNNEQLKAGWRNFKGMTFPNELIEKAKVLLETSSSNTLSQSAQSPP